MDLIFVGGGEGVVVFGMMGIEMVKLRIVGDLERESGSGSKGRKEGMGGVTASHVLMHFATTPESPGQTWH